MGPAFLANFIELIVAYFDHRTAQPACLTVPFQAVIDPVLGPRRQVVSVGQVWVGGLRLQNSNPMLLEDVAIDFPDIQIVIAHPSWPWQDEALSLALHKPNVWIDLSGWSPKYFPPQLVQYANTLLKDRILFGSDYPLITPERWMKDFDEAGFKDKVKPLILKDNAMRLLGLGPSAG